MAGLEEFRAPNGLQTPPSKLPLHAKELPVSAKIVSLQGEVFLPLNSVNATMASLEAGRVRKGKNFSVEEETCLCRSFLAVFFSIYRERVAGDDWAGVLLDSSWVPQ
jgi:hypothetical protein